MQYTRIEIAVKPDRDDPYAQHTWWEIQSTLGYSIKDLRTISVYTVYSNLPDERLKEFARDVLCDPVLSIYAVNVPLAQKLPPFTWALEVSYKPGVTDNVGRTAADVLRMMVGGDGGNNCQVYRSTQYLLNADLTLEEVEKVGREILFNDLIEEISILNFRGFSESGGFPVRERHYLKDYVPKVEILDLNIPDGELITLSSSRVLALTLDEMKYFRAHFEKEEVRSKRRAAGISPEPTDVELECFAQTQSEHCKHKIFNATIDYREGDERKTIQSIFKTYIKAATEKLSKEKSFLVSVFKDNAGVISFNDDYNLAFKVETHNTPSALDPYGGSITGIVGVDRDPAGTGIGSRIIAHTDVLCFGDPFHKAKLPPRMMHPRRIMAGVVKGIEDGGNKCGIPTINGGVIFDDSYRGKPLVFCGSVGIMPKRIDSKPTHIKEVKPGDIVVMVGGRIGKDGIHGATFSSEEISETSPVQAVQIGDPITQKKMLDMLVEARDRLLYRGITDNGAGGLSSSVGEMALISGGAKIDLKKAPLKYPGLDPWEILLSEAQERMTLAVPPHCLGEFLELASRRDVEATPIGEFTSSGYFHVTYGDKTVCYLDLDFLHSNIPMFLEAAWEEPVIEERRPSPPPSHNKTLMEMLGDINACSREPVIRRYDHEVGGNTVIKPLVGKDEVGPSDAGVIAPIQGDPSGFVLSAGINPFLSRVDTYHMASAAVDEAVRNAVVVGADPERIALLDNFCWPDPVYDPVKTPDGRYKLAQLVRAARGLHDTAIAYKAPFISGKDSMKNDYKVGEHKVSVLPTILVSAIGFVPDIRKCVTSDFKLPGDIIILLGKTSAAMGESLYYRKYGGSSKEIPFVDPEKNMELYRCYFKLVQGELISSGHDLSDGGLALALAECCIGGGIGAEVDISKVSESSELLDEVLLFSETPGRFLISIDPSNREEVFRVLEGVSWAEIGVVKDSGIMIVKRGENRLIEAGVEELTRIYRTPLYQIMGMKF